MPELNRFATRDYPTRASLLPLLVRCPMSAVLRWEAEMQADGGGSGPAADTGSAVHFAARVWHTVAEKDTRSAILCMREAAAGYPLADLKIAEQHFRCYADDPRNQEAEVILCEEKVKILLAPTEDDPTQEEIVVTGTVDQVRREADGRLAVWDIKTGKSLVGFEMLSHYALQLAAYQLGASLRLREPVPAAGIIRTQDYFATSPAPVFWFASWGWRHMPAILLSVRRRVAEIRRGNLCVVPGADCKWCPEQNVANCAPKLLRIGVSRAKV